MISDRSEGAQQAPGENEGGRPEGRGNARRRPARAGQLSIDGGTILPVPQQLVVR
jgi:hypothetical protein